MSTKELTRLPIIHKAIDKRLPQKDAAVLLDLSVRQVKRLVAKVRSKGDQAIVHGNRGRRSPNKISPEREAAIMAIVGKRYTDFGPTFAAEKLLECEKIRISKEKLRRFMIARGLWRPKSRDKRKIHQWRERKHHRGEMSQMDGSNHDWLESRGPKIDLIAYTDDATNYVFGRFYEFEGTFSAMDSLRRYISKYGLPFSLYIDRHSAYKTSRQPNRDEELKGEYAKTQFARLLGELEIRPIYALSPQAKGRIERTFRTFQDRLVKELRLANVCSLEQANVFLASYLPKYNARFARPPFRKGDYHRPVPKGLNLSDCFCLKESRFIGNDYTIRWKNRLFLVRQPSITMKKRQVCVMEHFDGKIVIKLNGKTLAYVEVTARDINALSRTQKAAQKLIKKERIYYPPPKDAPWRRFIISKRSLCNAR